ncbi:hypothetical protein V1282_003823 [Nitrobacteraceae bacterium AZCC 2146]|jgi:hypothetical protein
MTVLISKPEPAIRRALSIYGAVARHGSDPETKRGLEKHVRDLFDRGERDENRLTVHGLTYLRSRELRRR